MSYIYKISVVISCLFMTISCDRHLHPSNDKILARVGDEYLYFSDISNGIPHNISKTDSFQIIHSMADNWVKQEILLLHAKKNLPDSLKDFTNQIENYKNNLIIYEFKKRLVEQQLDTTISKQEIEDYYNNHQGDFQLIENIVQFAFIKIPAQSDQLEKAKELILTINDTSSTKIPLEEFCQNYATDYYLNNEQWIPFNELLKTIPIEAINQKIYLKNNKFIEIKDHPYWYFINLKDFKIIEDISPLAFEEDKIRNIILNKRKIELLSNLENDIEAEASNAKQFEIY